MKRFEVSLSFSYDAATPEEAVQMFMANIPLANWDVSARDMETGESFTVDTEDYTTYTN